MKALNLHGIDDLRYEEVSTPKPEKDEVLIKILAAGICGSDVPRVFTKGTYHFPTIIGHEFAGEIVAVGSDITNALIGKKAAVFPLLPCFKCDACKNEDYAACSDYDYYGSRRDGAFAEYIAVKVWNLVLVPDDVPIEWAAMAEPCAVSIHAIERIGIEKGNKVCIFGMGAIGMILALLARNHGAEEVILLDIDETKLEFARSIGFDSVINSMDSGYPDEILRLTGGKGPDICIDAAGVPATITACLNTACSFGKVLLLGNPSGDILLKQADYWQILRKQLTLMGTWNSDFSERKNDWEKALFYMESGAIDLTGFVTHSFSLEDGNDAFELVRDNKEFYVKVMFAPDKQES